MKKKKSGLSKKEKLFCLYFANSAQIAQSAKKAGFAKNPLKKGVELLSKKEVVKEIANITDSLFSDTSVLAQLGYYRLAFCGVADAISLMYMDSPSKEQLGNMDLFCVSEIKKPKDGAMEIKFFDKLKALEKLSTFGDDQIKDAGGLIDALNIGAKSISSIAGDDFGV